MQVREPKMHSGCIYLLTYIDVLGEDLELVTLTSQTESVYTMLVSL